MFIDPLYIFFEEISAQHLCPFFNQIVFVAIIVELYEFLIYSEY